MKGRGRTGAGATERAARSVAGAPASAPPKPPRGNNIPAACVVRRQPVMMTGIRPGAGSAARTAPVGAFSLAPARRTVARRATRVRALGPGARPARRMLRAVSAREELARVEADFRRRVEAAERSAARRRSARSNALRDPDASRRRSDDDESHPARRLVGTPDVSAWVAVSPRFVPDRTSVSRAVASLDVAAPRTHRALAPGRETELFHHRRDEHADDDDDDDPATPRRFRGAEDYDGAFSRGGARRILRRLLRRRARRRVDARRSPRSPRGASRAEARGARPERRRVEGHPPVPPPREGRGRLYFRRRRENNASRSFRDAARSLGRWPRRASSASRRLPPRPEGRRARVRTLPNASERESEREGGGVRVRVRVAFAAAGGDVAASGPPDASSRHRTDPRPRPRRVTR